MTDIITPPAADAVDPSTNIPTADEVAAAQALLQRYALSLKQQVQPLLPDVRALIALPGFDDIYNAATDLRDKVPQAAGIYHHLNAIVVGMGSLRADADVLAQD